MIVILLLLLLRGEPQLPEITYVAGVGLIGMDEQWGYYKDVTGRYPTPGEALLFHAGAEIWTNLYPGDQRIDDPTRALYFFNPTLASYADDIVAVDANLKRYPDRIVILISEPNNSAFITQYATPATTARRLAGYVDYIIPLCPTCQLYGPVLAQENVRGIDEPFKYLVEVLEALKDMGRVDVIQRLGIAYNSYQQGRTSAIWAWSMQVALRRLRAINVSYGGKDSAIVPEWGAPRGTVADQTIMATAIRDVLPALRAESVAAFYFAGPYAIEPGMYFNGKGNTHNADNSLTIVGHALGLRGCLTVADLALRWHKGATIVDLMQAQLCR
jgi:hypothetical protein